jgi:hypothetical protein
MSSEISTKPARSKSDDSLQPWQLFVLAGLGCATVVTYMARGQGPTPVVLYAVLMAGAVLVGVAMLRVLNPLVRPDEERTAMIGSRTRAALEREKMLVLRSIKDLEFDHAMGKLSDADWHEMSTRLRSRASGLIRQLDAGAGYRDVIERELGKRLATAGIQAPPVNACAQCSTINDVDARFCKNCGQKLGG